MLLLLILMGTALYFVLKIYRAKMRPTVEKAEKIPGPRTLPLVGNALEFGTSTKRNKAFLLSLPSNSFCLLQSEGAN
jgi:hypothetical protein